MNTRTIRATVILVVLLAVVGSMALAAQDRFTLKAPNGVAFSEFRGYETWPDVAVSETDDGLKVIAANTVAFIEKDSKRFSETSGWGYAQFLCDAPSDTFKPFGSDNSFGKVCYGCHTVVNGKDDIFTSYPGGKRG